MRKKLVALLLIMVIASKGMTVQAASIDVSEDVSVALMKYNGDSNVAGLLAGNGDVSEYADKILRISAELERENGK